MVKRKSRILGSSLVVIFLVGFALLVSKHSVSVAQEPGRDRQSTSENALPTTQGLQGQLQESRQNSIAPIRNQSRGSQRPSFPPIQNQTPQFQQPTLPSNQGQVQGFSSPPLVRPQESRTPQVFQHQRKSTPTISQTVPGNRYSNSTPPRFVAGAAASDVKTLIRATYKLPADAAETLTSLFELEATALVECQTVKTQENAHLVSLVVTAEPDTQQAIAKFVEMVFPAITSNELTPPTYTPESNSARSNTQAPIRRLVHVKLPNMTCGGCAAAVKNHLAGILAVSSIETRTQDKTLTFQCAPGTDVDALLNKAAGSIPFFKDYSLDESPHLSSQKPSQGKASR